MKTVVELFNILNLLQIDLEWSLATKNYKNMYKRLSYNTLKKNDRQRMFFLMMSELEKYD